MREPWIFFSITEVLITQICCKTQATVESYNHEVGYAIVSGTKKQMQETRELTKLWREIHKGDCHSQSEV